MATVDIAHYIENAFNTTSHTLADATGNNIPEPLIAILIRAATATIILNSLYILLTELQHQFLAFWFRRGVLTRVQETLPEDRDIGQALIAATSVTFPVSLYQAYNRAHFAAKTVVSFNVTEILVLQMALFLAVDTWYFWGHRFMHKNKFCWNYIHKHHHEKKNLNVYSTSYAAFVENLILVAPVIILTLAAYDASSIRFNKLAWHCALINQAIIFNIGHCGFRFNRMFHFMVLPSGVIHRVFQPFDLSQIPEDHEMHHLYPLSNFSLNFRIWDTIMGSYKSINHVVAMKEKRSQGVKAQ
ncbi:hypothetical protein HDU67_010117 [Dinochytrium kinnereticum]|nr:hypothetical protein HDU67_010117 [Dinochytrium kinnereticum]